MEEQGIKLFHLLREEARQWWYYKALRQRGEIKEARAKEHESVRNKVLTLREAKANGGYLDVGRGGWSLLIDDDRRLEYCHGCEGEVMPLVCALFGIPVIDSRVIEDDDILVEYAMHKPLVGLTKQDEPPYTGFSYAPLRYVADYARSYGADVINI